MHFDHLKMSSGSAGANVFGTMKLSVSRAIVRKPFCCCGSRLHNPRYKKAKHHNNYECQRYPGIPKITLNIQSKHEYSALRKSMLSEESRCSYWFPSSRASWGMSVAHPCFSIFDKKNVSVCLTIPFSLELQCGACFFFCQLNAQITTL